MAFVRPSTGTSAGDESVLLLPSCPLVPRPQQRTVRSDKSAQPWPPPTPIASPRSAPHAYEPAAAQAPRPAVQGPTPVLHAPSQRCAPSGHGGRALHAPAEQLIPAGHGVLVYPRPSGLHARRVVASAHESAPGTHTGMPQTPPSHGAATGHDDETYPSPSALQTRRSVGDAHAAVFGVHTHPRHIDPVHVAPAGQFVTEVLNPSAAQT